MSNQDFLKEASSMSMDDLSAEIGRTKKRLEIFNTVFHYRVQDGEVTTEMKKRRDARKTKKETPKKEAPEEVKTEAPEKVKVPTNIASKMSAVMKDVKA